MAFLVADVHNAVHHFGVPEQLVTPAASKAKRVRLTDVTYTMPFATAGDANPAVEPVFAVHKGAHVFGVPEQLVIPAASNASKPPTLLVSDPMYTTPSAMAGEEYVLDFPVASPGHIGVQALV